MPVGYLAFFCGLRAKKAGRWGAPRLDSGRGDEYNKDRKGAATSGWPDLGLVHSKNRHRAGWRFLRFLMMIVTVKLPMCIVIRMVSPPFGKCGQPPAVVVQRLAAEAAVFVYHVSTGFARWCRAAMENKCKIRLDFIPQNVLESFLQSNAICGSAGIGRQARLRCVCL